MYKYNKNKIIHYSYFTIKLQSISVKNFVSGFRWFFYFYYYFWTPASVLINDFSFKKNGNCYIFSGHIKFVYKYVCESVFKSLFVYVCENYVSVVCCLFEWGFSWEMSLVCALYRHDAWRIIYFKPFAI